MCLLSAPGFASAVHGEESLVGLRDLLRRLEELCHVPADNPDSGSHTDHSSTYPVSAPGILLVLFAEPLLVREIHFCFSAPTSPAHDAVVAGEAG